MDHFTWPRVCRRLIARAAEELDRLADALLAANNQGQKVLAIAGCRRGEGATTLLLCAARRLAERGVKPVLVDADLGRPRLAKRLGVQPQIGWDETTEEEGRSLDQAIVEATANNVALLPAREPPAECGRPAGDPSRLAACLEILQNHYDMVLVDLGPLEDDGADRRRWQRNGRRDDRRRRAGAQPSHHVGRATDGIRGAIGGGREWPWRESSRTSWPRNEICWGGSLTATPCPGD